MPRLLDDSGARLLAAVGFGWSESEERESLGAMVRTVPATHMRIIVDAAAAGGASTVAWPLFDGPGGMVMNLEPKSAPMPGWPHAADCAVWKSALGPLL